MPVSPPVRAQLKQLYGALADRVLEPGEPQYVAEVNAGVRADDGPVAEMVAEIDFQEGGGVCLFTGQRGTGKSTELKRLQAELEKIGISAFYIDLSEYVLLTKAIEISDFLISMAGGLSDAIEHHPKFSTKLAHRNYWERLSAFLQSEVSVDELKFKFGTYAEVKASLKNDPDFKKRIQQAARGHLAKLVKDAHSFFAEAVKTIQVLEADPERKVVLIVDSVERIRGVGDEAMQVFDSVRNLFFAHAEHLQIPLLHVVYTVPPYLSILAAGAGSVMGGATVRRIVSAHIFQDRTRNVDPEGLRMLRRVVQLRYADWQQIFSGEALDHLAVLSGGDLRGFFRLLRNALTTVRDDADLPLTVERIKSVETAARAEMLPIPGDQLAWLRKIAASHEPQLAAEDQLPMLAHFLDNQLVMNYRNGRDWYDVHPLIRDTVDAYSAN